MASKLEKIYAVMPVGLQNFMLSARGWSLMRKRKAGGYSRYFEDLMRSQWFSAEEFRNLQTIELRKLIVEAVESTTYYKRVLGKYMSDLENLTLDNINDIPILEKSVLREQLSDFINSSKTGVGCGEVHTSGTSGTPLTLPYDLESSRRNRAFRERQCRWGGVSGSDVSVRFSGRLILGKRNQAPFWRYNAAQRQWFFSTYHMTEENLPLYAEKLRLIKPAYLDGYPSSLYVLARWFQSQKDNTTVRPWAIITTAETLGDHQRKLIESVFKCPVFDQYSSTEGAPWITQCPAGRYHINCESGIIEILRPDGQPADDGEIGEMIVTSFFQRTVPLIRYRIGDTAICDKGICPCGRNMPLVKSITGRMDDQLWSKERGYVGRLGPIFKSIPSSIKEAQLVQTALDEVELKYVPDYSAFKSDHMDSVLTELKGRLGESMSIKLTELAEIPRGKNGKFRTFVREVDLPSDA